MGFGHQGTLFTIAGVGGIFQDVALSDSIKS